MYCPLLICFVSVLIFFRFTDLGAFRPGCSFYNNFFGGPHQKVKQDALILLQSTTIYDDTLRAASFSDGAIY